MHPSDTSHHFFGLFSNNKNTNLIIARNIKAYAPFDRFLLSWIIGLASIYNHFFFQVLEIKNKKWIAIRNGVLELKENNKTVLAKKKRKWCISTLKTRRDDKKHKSIRIKGICLNRLQLVMGRANEEKKMRIFFRFNECIKMKNSQFLPMKRINEHQSAVKQQKHKYQLLTTHNTNRNEVSDWIPKKTIHCDRCISIFTQCLSAF